MPAGSPPSWPCASRWVVGTVADRAVAAAALASARGGEAAPDAVADIPPDGSTAPLVPLTEQQVVRADRSRPGSIVAVYPKGGSPSLDYPVLRVPAAAATTKQRRAVERVLDVLRSSRTVSLASAAAFRDAHGAGSLAATKKPVKTVPLPDAATVQQLLLRLQSLAAPSRILALLDVSTSMRAPVGNGQNRAQVLRDAAIGAVALMRGEDQVGAWVFAADLTAGHDYAPLVGVQPLRVPEAGATHRDQVVASLRALPAHLKPGGTGLYQTVRDAVHTMQKSYDPRASNVVVVLTDGQNDRSKGPTLSALLGTLRSTADPKRPVRVIAVGISGDADMAALTRIAAATPGGRAYLAERPSTLQTVLFDALTNR